MYDFDSIINRNSTGSIKHDYAPEPVRGSGFVPLTIADMEFVTAPAITNSIIDAAKHGVYGYTYADSEYFNAVRGWMKRRHSWDVERDWLTTTNGVVPALGIAVRALTEKGDGVLIQPPVYPPFASTVTQNGRTLVENPLLYRDGRYEIDFSDFETKCGRADVKLFLLCSPHNPVGRVWTVAELTRIADICARNNVVVVSDEIHNDLILHGNTHTIFANIESGRDNCIVCTAISKTFNLAGLSCSNIFVPNAAINKRFSRQAQLDSSGCVPFFARAATIAAYNECGDWLDCLIKRIDTNFDVMYAFFHDHLPMLSVVHAEGTYLAWADMRGLNLDAASLEKLMLETAYLALDEGYIFGINGSGFERWNLAMPTPLLVEALMRLESAVRKL